MARSSKAGGKRRTFSYQLGKGAPRGARVLVSVPPGIFGTWSLRLEWPGQPPLSNTAHVACGPDHRLKARWRRNLGTGVNASMQAAFNRTLLRLGAGRICSE